MVGRQCISSANNDDRTSSATTKASSSWVAPACCRGVPRQMLGDDPAAATRHGEGAAQIVPAHLLGMALDQNEFAHGENPQTATRIWREGRVAGNRVLNRRLFGGLQHRRALELASTAFIRKRQRAPQGLRAGIVAERAVGRRVPGLRVGVGKRQAGDEMGFQRIDGIPAR